MNRAWSVILGVVAVTAIAAFGVAVEFPFDVRDIEVEGNEEIRTRTILDAIPWDCGREVTEEEVRQASQAIHDLGWFREVLPRFEEEGTIVFRVVENPIVEEIQIAGNINEETLVILGVTILRGPIVSDGRMRRILRRNDVRVGRVLNTTGLDAAVEEILEVYEDRGYALVNIAPVQPGPIVRIQVLEGRVAAHEIRGLRTVPETVARELIQVPEEKVLRTDAFQATAAALQDSVYFTQVDLELAAGTSDDSVTLVWTLAEQTVLEEPVEADGFDLIGVTRYPDRLVDATLGDLPEGPVDNFAALRALEGVHELYHRAGYVMVRFTAGEALAGDLQIEVHEGRIGAIQYEGNERTRDAVIAKGLRIRTGDVLNRSQLAVGYQALMALGYFDTIDLIPEWDGDEVQLTVVIEETEKLGGLNGSVAFSPDSGGLVGELDYRQLNLFGTGQDMRLSYSRGLLADESATYEIGYSTVTLFPQFNRVGVDLYQSTDTRTVGDDEEEARFVTLGGEAEISYPWADYTSLSMSFKRETVREQGTENSELVQSITVGMGYDDANNPRFPTTGTRRSIAIEKAGGFAPGAEFTKIDLEAAWFVPVLIPVPFLESRDQVVATRAVFGWGIDLPLSQVYEFGGATTIRGADVDTVQRLFFTNIEYRVAVIEGLSTALFLDAGMDLERMCDSVLKGSFGIELGMDAAGVRVRLDLSWPISPAITWVPRFTFGFGPMF
jgi:outer membrane protein insertion porin family